MFAMGVFARVHVAFLLLRGLELIQAPPGGGASGQKEGFGGLLPASGVNVKCCGWLRFRLPLMTQKLTLTAWHTDVSL